MKLQINKHKTEWLRNEFMDNTICTQVDHKGQYSTFWEEAYQNLVEGQLSSLII